MKSLGSSVFECFHGIWLFRSEMFLGFKRYILHNLVIGKIHIYNNYSGFLVFAATIRLVVANKGRERMQ